MRGLLLGVAASLAAITLAAPAGAQALAFNGQSSPFFSGGFGSGSGDGFRRDGRRHSRRGDNGVFIYDREYQGDTAWRATSYNDWWHERPQRSYPAWMSRNQNCERLYWSGGGWRC